MNLLLAFVLTAAVLTSGSVVKPPGENFELLILHNNDMHARFEQTSQLSGACTTADREAGKCYGGFPRVAHVVKEARRAAQTGEGPPVLYLNAGDTYTGTAWFTIYKWKIAAEFINALQPDAVSLGNHEFDNGVSGLTPFIKNLKCPVLAANLDLSKVPELKAEHNLVNSVVFDINNTKIGVVGYLTPETKTTTIKNDVEYVDEITAITNEIEKLKDQGVKIFIGLGHSGFSKDLEIAKMVRDIDLVIGGHTNTFLFNGTSPDIEESQGPYPIMVEQKCGRLVPVLQAYAHTKYMGKLHIVFDSNGKIVRTDGNPILLDYSIPQDTEVLKIVNEYRENILELTERVIGTTLVNLDGQSCRLRECNMGNLITDGMIQKYAAKYKGIGWSDSPIAVMNSGAIRIAVAVMNTNLPANITQGDLMTIMPFDGNIVKVTLNGSNVKKMLENSVLSYNTLNAPGAFLQMSGMKVEYDLEEPPGKRVKKVYLRCSECLNPDYLNINDAKMYTLLVPLFLASGGDGYSVFDDTNSTVVGFNTLESTAEYIFQHSPISSSVEGRITLNNANKIKGN